MKHIYEDLRNNEILIMIYYMDNGEESILTLWRLLTLSGGNTDALEESHTFAETDWKHRALNLSSMRMEKCNRRKSDPRTYGELRQDDG